MKHTIKVSELVEVELSPWGRVALAADLDRKISEIVGDRPDRQAFKSELSISIPMVEAFRVFGPLTQSAFLVPIRSITIELPDDQRIGVLERDQALLKKGVINYSHALSAAAQALGIDGGYASPEDLKRRVEAYAHDSPSRVPDGPGQWWLKDRVVTVEAGPGSGHPATPSFGLLVRLGNNRRKPVESYDVDDWGGPAKRDPRLAQSSEDIPF